MDYVNLKRYPLRYSDYDFKDELRLSSLLSLTQESAGASADELGFGYSVLKPRHLGFLVAHTYCELRRQVRLGATLTVETWPLPPRHVIFERDYRVSDEEGEVAVLASRWCLVDLETFALLPPDALGEAHARCPYRAEKTVEVPKWKLPRLPEGLSPVRTMRVEASHTDHYLHANNAQYADFFLDCFSREELARMQLSAFQIAYVKQMRAGETVEFYREDGPDGSALEARVGGTLCAQMHLYFQN